MKRILIEGGYIEDGIYHFYIQDHLGNNRVVAKADGTVVQTNHYYPFGMSFAEGTYPDKQPYKYNGKELDTENGLNWYDYEARMMALDLPGFICIDPLAEKYYSISPYVYCNNNPIRNIDPDGRYWLEAKDEEYAKKLQQEMGSKAKSEQKRLDKLNIKIAKNQEKDKDVSKDQVKAEGIQVNIDNLNAGISELTAMGETTEQGFTYNMTDGDVGYASVGENGVIVMDIAGNGSISNGIHESTHGYDMWKEGKTTKENFLDRELKAYGRQFSFGGAYAVPASDWYKPIKSLSDINDTYVLGIKHNNEYIYGKMYHGRIYNYKRMQDAFRTAKRNKW